MISRSAIAGVLATILLLFSTDLVAQDSTAAILASASAKMTLVGYRAGHFTSRGLTEYVAFYQRKNTKLPDTIDQVMVIGIDKQKIGYSFDLDLSTLPYPQWALDRIKNPKLNFGTWDGHCFVSDFNDNGLDEILFFSLSGMSFDPFIFEYHNNEMTEVLGPPPSAWNTIVRMETGTSDGKKYIAIWGSAETKSSKIPWFKFAWDARKSVYGIAAKGYDDAP